MPGISKFADQPATAKSYFVLSIPMDEALIVKPLEVVFMLTVNFLRSIILMPDPTVIFVAFRLIVWLLMEVVAVGGGDPGCTLLLERKAVPKMGVTLRKVAGERGLKNFRARCNPLLQSG